jgi:hypothetical protein
MRIAGTFLLLGGFLLCISIIWAAVGFLMMGLGLICLLMVERRKKPSTASSGPLADAAGRPREPPPLQVEKHAQPAAVEASPSRIGTRQASLSFPEPRLPEPRLPESRQPKPRKPALVSRKERPVRRPDEPDSNAYDLEKWRALVKSDADISRSVEAVLPFGKKYVDQLAMAYLAFEEKSYLPAIVKMVADAIKKDSGRDSASLAEIDGDPDTDLISFAMSKARTSAVQQVFASAALNDGREKSSATSNALPQAGPDARVTLAAVQSQLKTSRSRPQGGAGSPRRLFDAWGEDEGLAGRATTAARMATASVNDAQDLIPTARDCDS